MPGPSISSTFTVPDCAARRKVGGEARCSKADEAPAVSFTHPAPHHVGRDACLSRHQGEVAQAFGIRPRTSAHRLAVEPAGRYQGSCRP